MTQNLTVKVREIEFEIQFDYTPETPSIMYSRDGDVGDEGTHEEVEIQTIIHNGEDMFEVFEDDLTKFKDAIIAEIHGNNY